MTQERRHREERRKTPRVMTEDEIASAIVTLAGELRERTRARVHAEQVYPISPGRHSGMGQGILAALSRHPEGITVDEIRQELRGMGVRTEHIDVQLVRFARRGLIVKTGIPRKSRYRIAKGGPLP